jgi:hypothetical protein
VALLAGSLLATGVLPASAALSTSLDPLTLPSVTASHQPQTVTGRTVLTASDLGPVPGLGWHVNVQASNLVYSGPNQGMDIPAGYLSIVSAEAPVASSGQPVDSVNGPMVPVVSPAGSLDIARMVLHSNAGYGAGVYTQGIHLSLMIPADTRAGTYTSTITTTIAAGP